MEEKHIVFLKHLAKRLVEGVKKRFSNKILRSYFHRILQELPDGDSLKMSLVDNHTKCLRFFVKYTQKIAKKEVRKEKKKKSADHPHVDTESGATAEVTEANHDESLGSSNKKHRKNARKKKSEQFLNQLPFGVRALFVAQQLEKVISLQKLSKFADSLMSCAPDQDVDKYCRLLQLMAGTSTITTLKKIMQLYLNELQPVTEEIVKNKSKEEAIKRSKHLQRFLHLCHLKQPASDLGDDHPTYADLLASMLSLYLDLVLISHRDVEEQWSVCSFVHHLMSEVATRLFDVVLQVTAVDQQNGALLLPLLRKIFAKKPRKNNPENYLRYCLAVRMWTKLLPVLKDVKAESRDLPAPKGFIHWLLKKNPALSEEIPTDHKFKGRLVTAFILDDVDDNMHDLLLDVLTELEKKTGSTSTEAEAGLSLLQVETNWSDLEAEVSEDERSARDDIKEAKGERKDREKEDEETRSYYKKILGDSFFCIDRGAKRKPEAGAKFSRTPDEEKTSRKKSTVDGANLKIVEEKEIYEAEREGDGGEEISFYVDREAERNIEADVKEDRTPNAEKTLRKKKKKSIERMTDINVNIAKEAAHNCEVDSERKRGGEESVEIRVPDNVEKVFCIDRGASTRFEAPAKVENVTNRNKSLTLRERNMHGIGRTVDKASLSVAEAGVKVCEHKAQEGKKDGQESSDIIEIPVDEDVSFIIDRGLKTRRSTGMHVVKSASDDYALTNKMRSKTPIADKAGVGVKDKKDVGNPDVLEVTEGKKKHLKIGKSPVQESLSMLSSANKLDIESLDGDANQSTSEAEGETKEDNVVDVENELIPKVDGGDKTSVVNSEKLSEMPPQNVFYIDKSTKTVSGDSTELQKVTHEGGKRQKRRKSKAEEVDKSVMDVVKDGQQLERGAEDQEVTRQGKTRRRTNVDSGGVDVDAEDGVMITEDGDFFRSSLRTGDGRTEVLSDTSESLLGPADTWLQVDRGLTAQRTEQNEADAGDGEVAAAVRDGQENMASDITKDIIVLGLENIQTVQSSSRKSRLSIKKHRESSEVAAYAYVSSPAKSNVQLSHPEDFKKSCNFDPDKGVGVWILPGTDHKPSSLESLENAGASSQFVEVGPKPVNAGEEEVGTKVNSAGSSPASNLLTPGRKRKSFSGKNEESEVRGHCKLTESSQKSTPLSTKKSPTASFRADTSSEKASGFEDNEFSSNTSHEKVACDDTKPVNADERQDGAKPNSAGSTPASNLLTPGRKRKSFCGKNEELEVCGLGKLTESSQKSAALSTKKSPAANFNAGTSPKKASSSEDNEFYPTPREKVTSVDTPQTVNCESTEKDSVSCKKTPDSKVKSVTPVSRRTRGQQKRPQGETPNTRMPSGELYENLIMASSKKKSSRQNMQQSAQKKKQMSTEGKAVRPSVSDRIEELGPRSEGSSDDSKVRFTELRKSIRNKGGIQDPLGVSPPKKARLSEADVSGKSAKKGKNQPGKQQAVCLDPEQGDECSSSPGKSPVDRTSRSNPSEQKSKVRHSEPCEALSPRKAVSHDIVTRSKLKGYNLRVHSK